jgi:hypothetical protein
MKVFGYDDGASVPAPTPPTCHVAAAVCAAEVRRLQIAAYGVEFTALRAEIGRLIDHQKDLHTLSYVSLAALLGFVGVLADKDTTVEGLATVLLLVPLLTFQFALTAADLSRRILQLARYLDRLSANANRVLRSLASEDLTTGLAVWDWERWKTAQFDEMDDSDQRAATFLEKSRWLALAFPGLLGVGSYLVLDPTPLTGALEWTLFVIAVVALLWSVVLLLTYRPEVKGIPTAKRRDQSVSRTREQVP